MTENLRAMLDELVASVADLERSNDGDPRVAGWAAAHRQRLASLRLAFDREAEMLDALADVTDAEDDSIGIALGRLMEMTQAQRGFIVLRASDGALTFPAARPTGTELAAPELHISRSILHAALSGSTSLRVADALTDDRFARDESVQALAVRAALAVPILARGRTWGVVYLDNPLLAGAFSADSARVAEQFARIIGPILERDVALREVDREHAS